jgi:hypothetical protein
MTAFRFVLGVSLLTACLVTPARAFDDDDPPYRRLTVPDETVAHRLGLGIAYLGAQARWRLSSRWSVEGRYQRGSASSQYGKVIAQAYGLRAYRFYHAEGRLPLYWGLEAAYSSAKPETSTYATRGPAGGAFGGLEYRIGRRFAVDLDIGPYVIALKEKKTGMSQTNLDFVVNTAAMVFLF